MPIVPLADRAACAVASMLHAKVWRIKYSFTKPAESGQNLPVDNIHGEKVRLSDV
jgi:hypothetical protein